MPSEVRMENFWIWTMKKQNIKKYYAKQSEAKKIMEKLHRAPVDHDESLMELLDL